MAEVVCFGTAVRKLDLPDLKVVFCGMHDVSGEKVPIFCIDSGGRKTYITLLKQDKLPMVLVASELEGLKSMVMNWLEEE